MRSQKYLSTSAMVAFITFMNMFIPLSTDMYLPALPEMGHYFMASNSLVSFSLTIFFFMFAVSMVLFGPLSDKYGRRPILLAGTAIYTLTSIVCALSPNIYVLILGRLFQGVGAGAVITVATALIKDCFRGRLMTRILAVTQAASVIAPMAAPLVGGFLLNFTSWRGAFILLGLLGALNFALSFLYSETLPPAKRYQGNVSSSLSLLWALGKQRHFMVILVMFSLLAAPYMAYLSVSSFVYIETFALNAQEYSYFFAVNSAAAVVGPVIYLRLRHAVSDTKILWGCFMTAAGSALLVLFPGHWGAAFFLFAFLPFTISESLARPFSMDLLLNEAKEHTGTASSMINFVQTLFGSIGMMLGTLPWGDFIDGLGTIMLGSVVLAVCLWRSAGKL